MMQHSSPQHYVPYGTFQGDSPNRSDSVSSGGTDVSQSSDRQEYDVPVVPSQQYAAPPEYLAAAARMSWPNVEKMQFSEFAFQGKSLAPPYNITGF